MSVHRTKATSRTILTRLAGAASATVALTALAAAPAIAKDQPEPDQPPTVVYRDPPRDNGFDTTSIAAGALGGIAFAGAGLGIALGVQRRRDHSVLQST
jgi:hypothetical protein